MVAVTGQIDTFPDAERARRVLTRGRWIMLGGVLASVAFLVYGYVSGAFSSVDELRQVVDRLGPFGPLALILLQAAQVVVPVVPGGVGIVAGPILYGPVLGTVYNYVGICAGSIFVFHLARQFGMPLIRSMFSAAMLDRYRRWTSHHSFTTLFALAIVLPVAPDDFLCYMAGTTAMRARTYWLIILLGKPWAIIAYTFGLIQLAQHIPGIGGLL